MPCETVTVVGGGIVGLSSALALRQAGVPTLLLDPEGERPAASWGNAGHVAIEQVAPLASRQAILSAPRRLTIAGGALSLPPRQIGRWLPFAVRMIRAAAPARYAAGQAALATLLAQAMPAWRRLAQNLERPSLLVERGHLVVWHDAAAARRGIAAWSEADIGTARLHVADAAERAALGRALGRAPAGAVIFENTGQVADPGAVLAALRHAFRQAGGEIRRDRVRGIAVTDGRASLATEAGTAAPAGTVLVAAGVDAGVLLRPAGLRAPVIAERGYHVQAARHRWPADLPPVVFEERSMIVTRFEGGLRAAGFVEFSRADAPPDEAKWRRLEAHAAALDLPVEGGFARWFGSRPTLPDYLPAIGRAGGAGNLFYAFGHQHLGLTLGPLTGEIMARLVTGRPAGIDLAPYSLDRFGRLI